MSNSITTQDLRSRSVDDFDDIGRILDELSEYEPMRHGLETPSLELAAGGTAFVTFAYDIDGVTMEIAKYGAALGQLFADAEQQSVIHVVGGSFAAKVDVVLDSTWKRHVIANTDGCTGPATFGGPTVRASHPTEAVPKVAGPLHRDPWN